MKALGPLITVALVMTLAGCQKQKAGRSAASSAPTSKPASPQAPPSTAGCATPTDSPAAAQDDGPAAHLGPRTKKSSPSGKVELVTAIAAGQAAASIADEIALATTDNKRCVVYVGATWCEPCKRFKKALLAGELDTELQGARLLEFDADLDKSRLNAAGYSWRYVPFFAVPRLGGDNSGRVTAGVPSKSAPMAPLAKRIATLLNQPPNQPSTAPTR